jgi:hypothetical protein
MLAKQLEPLIERYRQVWLARHRPGGPEDSTDLVPNLYTRKKAQHMKAEMQRVLDEVRREAKEAGRDSRQIAHNDENGRKLSGPAKTTDSNT